MTKSEKIKIIKEITNALCDEEWGIIDLTLNQFGFSITDTFTGSKSSYIIQALNNDDDESLIGLASHLNIVEESADSEINPGFWKDGYLRLFISHLATNKENAQNIKNLLEQYSITGFVAHTDIEPTKEWQDEIEMALRTCDAMLVLMVPDFHESKWTDQEIGVALGRDLLIIPVRMGQDPYGFIGKYQAISYTDNTKLVEDVYASIVKNKQTSKKMAYSLMYKFENSNSFMEARSNMFFVRDIQFWDDKLINRLKNSVKNNSQISGSWGVSDSIITLLKEIEKNK
jgi:hypothetical protein